MSNDIVPTEPKHWLTEFNLPAVLLGPAGKAISRLIGEAFDIPSAGIHRIVQGIKDKTEAKRTMTIAVAEAAAKQVVADPELVARAANSFLSKELRAQTNKEAVAEKAIAILGTNPEDIPSSAPDPIDDDWLNTFERYAEDASSDRLRDLWGRVLAGQIRKPRTFSLRTLAFIAQLDHETASLFEKYAAWVIDGSFIIMNDSMSTDPAFGELLSLQEAGLISGAEGFISRKLPFGSDGRRPLQLFSQVLIIEGNPSSDIDLSCVNISRVGREIYSILTPESKPEIPQELANFLPKNGLSRISLGTKGKTLDGRLQVLSAKVLWQAPAPAPPNPTPAS